MIRILNSALQLQAILDDILPNPSINEEINREFTFSFSTVIDEEKSQFITSTSIIEVENNFFQVGLLEKKRKSDGSLLIDLDCEHVSYQLLDKSVEFFTEDGTPTQILTVLLAGTGFTLGNVEITNIGTVSIQEETNKRDILIGIAEAFGGELEFDKFTIHLRTRRGVNNGVHFRVGKNLRGVTRVIDNRDKDALGSPKFAFGIDLVELSELAEFGALETIRLGDTVQVIDADLAINESGRVVRYEFDPLQKRNSKVDISNFVDNITDRVLKIERQSLVKETIYNGIRIGPADGFVATRSDLLARAIMNATDGIKLQKGDGLGGFTDQIFLDPITGAGRFTGVIEASSFIGGTISIGSGDSIFKADSNGIYLGNATFASAPFRVTPAGALTATSATITGTINATGGTFSGSITASGTITGGALVGATITGGTVRTASSGARIELSGNSLKTFNTSNNFNGPAWGDDVVGNTFGDVFLFDDGTKVLEFFNNSLGQGYTIRPVGMASLFLGTSTKNTFGQGNWNFISGSFKISGGTAFDTITQTGTSGATLPQLEAQVNTIIQNLRAMNIYAV